MILVSHGHCSVCDCLIRRAKPNTNVKCTIEARLALEFAFFVFFLLDQLGLNAVAL